MTLIIEGPEKDDLNMISKLRQELLENRLYDKMARPVKDSNKTVIVEIKYFGIYNLDLDIKSGALTTNLGIFISWTDEHLTWNKSEYQGLDEIVMKASDVWRPTFLGKILRTNFELNFVSDLMLN